MDVKRDEENVQQYIKFLEHIKNCEVREFTRGFIENKIPEYFTHIAASSSGKYHPEYSLGEGGLLRHSMAVATLIDAIAPLEYLQLNLFDRDLLFAAALIHDSFKQGKTECGTTIRSHPNVAAQEILAYGKETGHERIAQLIGGLVVAHMGQWGNQKPGNRGQFLVHLADYLASRKFLKVEWDHILDPESK